MMNQDLYRKNLPEEDRHSVEWFEKQAADAPASDKGLAIHAGAIVTLRAKGYSYREIAVWFTERGCKVNHVDVWRAHKNSLDAQNFFAAAEHDEEWQQYLSKKQEGNSTVYEEKELPEDVEEKLANPEPPKRKTRAKQKSGVKK